MLINWDKPANAIHNLVRGLSPYPAAFTFIGEKTAKIFADEIVEEAHHVVPGTFETDHSTYLRFAAMDGWLYVKELQLEGKKRMPVVDFLRGFRSK